MNKRKHSSLTFEQQLKIKEKFEGNKRIKQQELANWANSEFKTNIDRSTVSKLLKRLENHNINPKYLQTRRMKQVKFPELDEKLFEWVKDNFIFHYSNSNVNKDRTF